MYGTREQIVIVSELFLSIPRPNTDVNNRYPNSLVILGRFKEAEQIKIALNLGSVMNLRKEGPYA